jgi:peptidylprolyl isomerase
MQQLQNHSAFRFLYLQVVAFRYSSRPYPPFTLACRLNGMRNAIIIVAVVAVLGGLALWLTQNQQNDANRQAAEALAQVAQNVAPAEAPSALAQTQGANTMSGYTQLEAKATRTTQFAKAEQVIDAAKYDYRAEVETSKGKVVIDLFATEAPLSVNSFVHLALNRYYEGIVFHRVIPGFMAQTGDPTGTGTGGPGYKFALEVTPKLNYDKPGVLGMARTNDPNSNGSQFFITFQPTPFLNQQYSIFGQVVEGMEVVNQIAKTEGVPSPASGDKRDKIVSVKILQKAK